MSRTQMPSTIEVSIQDNGKTIVLAQNQTLVIRLQENPTTGYRWVVESSDKMKLVADEYFPFSEGIGAGGTRQLRWNSISAGRSHIILELRRSWEQKGAAIEHFRLVVISPE